MQTQHPVPETTLRRPDHEIVSTEEWIEARRNLLKKEKILTRQMDALSAERRKLPWVEVHKEYIFQGPRGKETLRDLFSGKSQLITYHFMFGPGWKEGCRGCSFLADHIDGAKLHLAHHDVSLVAISRAPFAELEPFKKRMGWQFHWVSSFGSDFNFDYHVSSTEDEIAAGKYYYNYRVEEGDGDEHPGVSVFYRDAAGAIYHTYSSYARGGDILIGAHNYLDLTPKGRNEKGTMGWVRHHDQYENSEVKEGGLAGDDESETLFPEPTA